MTKWARQRPRRRIATDKFVSPRAAAGCVARIMCTPNRARPKSDVALQLS